MVFLVAVVKSKLPCSDSYSRTLKLLYIVNTMTALKQYTVLCSVMCYYQPFIVLYRNSRATGNSDESEASDRTSSSS